jgi:hypothetical protein
VTFQEYMLGEGQDYSQMILNLKQAGKLGSKHNLAKYPLYNTLLRVEEDGNYQRARVFEFKEASKKDKLSQAQKLKLAEQRAKYEERISKKRCDNGTVSSLGYV